MNYTECDFKACGKKGAMAKCGKCFCVYYCNRECQVSDWRNHKSCCSGEAQLAKEFKAENIQIENYLQKTAECTANGCSLCLETVPKEMQSQLGCNHVICSMCMAAHAMPIYRGQLTCPLCTMTVSPSVIQCIYKNATDFLRRAKLPLLSSEQVNKWCALARIEIEKIPCFVALTTPALLLFIAELNLYEGRNHIAIDMAQTYLNTYKWNTTDVEERTRQHLANAILANACMNLDDYHKAKEILLKNLNLVSKYSQPGDSFQFNKTLRGLSQCAYELEEYNDCICYAEEAIACGRWYFDVYTYLTLTYKKQGNLDKAIETMRRAVRYEMPWNEIVGKHREKQLQELIAEKERSEK